MFSTNVPVSSWTCLAFSPDSRRLVTGLSSLCLWDMETGQSVINLKLDSNVYRTAHFSPDGKWLGCSSLDGLHLWRAPTWEEMEAMEIQDVE